MSDSIPGSTQAGLGTVGLVRVFAGPLVTITSLERPLDGY